MLKMFVKELKLDVLWVVYVFPILGILTIVPNYPLIVGMGYSMLAVFIFFQYMRENLSREFAATLPVKRSHIVGATVLVVVMIQMGFILFGAIGGIASKYINTDGNPVGMDANLAFFGISFVCCALFNLIFFPMHYKTGYKLGVPVVLGLVAFLAFYAVCEIIVQTVPALTSSIDGRDPDFVWARAAVLAGGVVLYVLATLSATKIAVKNFEKVTL